MKIQFDAQQQYQLDAVAAVVDIFDGQPLQQPEYSVVYQQGRLRAVRRAGADGGWDWESTAAE